MTYSICGLMHWRVSIIAGAILFNACGAWACAGGGQPPDTDALIEAEKTMRESDSTIQRVLAYGILLRTADPNARKAAIRMGYGTDDPDLRGTALHCDFVQASGILVDTMPLDEADDAMPDMTAEARSLIEEGRTFNFPFYFVDAAQGCASINGHSDDECPAAYSASVSGTTLAFQNDRNLFGRFELTDENTLVGEIGIFNGTGHTVVPATAKLN